MNLGDLKNSKFLKKEDVGNGKLVTISLITKENVAMEGKPPDYKYAAHFEETNKPLVLNSTNGQMIARIAGSESDIENTWRGTKIILYNDPNVSYQGELKGGIRVRPPTDEEKQNAAIMQSPTENAPSDELPF